MISLLRQARATARFITFGLWIVVIILIQFPIVKLIPGRGALYFPRLVHHVICLIFGVRIKRKGKIKKRGQVLFVANHLSYLDIPLLGSLLLGSFIAKADVRGWPIFGFLGTLQRTAYMDRRPSAARREGNNLAQRLREGENMIFFPEGTSTDGRSVVPFKSSLFGAVLETVPHIFIQPVTLRVLSADGHAPKTQDERDLYAWHRNMTTSLAAHLWCFAQTSGAVIELTFHPAFTANDHPERKALAKAAYEAVSKGLENI